MVLKGSGVADERLNIHFTIFITGNLRIKKNDFLASKTPQ
jgi:hypothetical protein